MANILFVYSTTDGHTLKISQTMQTVMEQAGEQVQLLPLDQVNAEQLSQCDKLVIGASIRYGKHQPSLVQFITDNKSLIESKPSAFFTVNLVARKAEKCEPHTNPYIIKLLDQLAWQPSLQGVFAGKLHYQQYGFLDRNMIRFIMWVTKGPTDPTTNQEFTDWQKVDEFAQAVCQL
ncbi:menaquinone-dependent protoporphyrinogen IX dehydrogenase [Marinomonas posidonica]|uniref:Protoporphyrinogen IX dehydrogenase [quinone] n=1 Tax=Marinomonas posidonica (strain CECT 7376 / NCIMB 14433 / IVIA-Po-181) TaxID=491952 RepID=F6CVI2_MARPP|nr:menaquinone-dependent protoporphyrinogen IX dehydrogenase [Marinomonas posidonica]AEF55359.1 Protoporphyrinogen oxidase [Marinomonas posidonica IVIA-Po-181]